MRYQHEKLHEDIVVPYMDCENVEPENHVEMTARVIPSAAALVNMAEAVPDIRHLDELIDSTRVMLDAMEHDTQAAFACALNKLLCSPLTVIRELSEELTKPSGPDPTGERIEGITLEFIGSGELEDFPPEIQELIRQAEDPLRPQEGEQN